MFQSWLMHYLEIEVMQHVDPASSSPMRIRYRCQPLKWFLVCPQDEMCPMKVLPKMHDSPNQRIALAFHWMELLLHLSQAFACIRHNLLKSALPL
jgi:hypothetical protein